MEYIKENEILLHEELSGRSYEETKLTTATKRFRDNIKLVYSVARKYRSPRDPASSKEDLIQEGYIGLWKACLNFDESKGFQFSTYAVRLIDGEILRFLRGSNPIGFSRSYISIRNSISKHGFELPLTEEEVSLISQELNIPKSKILTYREFLPISLNDDTILDGGKYLSECIPDTQSEDLFTELANSEDELISVIDSVLDYISERDKDIVEEYLYARLEGSNITQNELAVKYKKSQGQISRIINRAIAILRLHDSSIRQLFSI